MASSPSSNLRWVACTSIRFGVSAAGPIPFEGFAWDPFLVLLHDADLQVRHAALLTLGSIIQHAPESLRTVLKLTDCKIPIEDAAEPRADLDGVGLLPMLYFETERREGRTRKV